MISTPRLKELESETLLAVRKEDKPTDYIKAQALEDGYKLALEDLEPVLAAAQRYVRNNSQETYQALRDALAALEAG